MDQKVKIFSAWVEDCNNLLLNILLAFVFDSLSTESNLLPGRLASSAGVGHGLGEADGTAVSMSIVGTLVGAEGQGLGEADGLNVETEGDLDGELVGNLDGELDGDLLGELVGDLDGELDGDLLGELVGDLDGELVGDLDGELVGDLDGEFDGELVGELVGVNDSIDGAFPEGDFVEGD